jgi:signal transduction histidine kinase
MPQFSFKNRIASYYIITTALLIFVVFFVIYSMVKFSVHSHLNHDIKSEVEKHLSEIKIEENYFHLMHKQEWKEREHNTLDVNPVFIQFIDQKGVVVEKSPNLKRYSLPFYSNNNNVFFDSRLANKTIRQIQVPIYSKTKIIGYLLVAMSLEDASLVLYNLSKVLVVAYPLILIVLFLIARLIAGSSIKPISAIIETSNIITKDNLKARIPYPQNHDELYVLSKTINHLLDRIETTIEREKQFTSDASHELRTPLTVIKGTLEVLVRKPRAQLEYEDKINFCITEVNRLNHLVDQLLLLARFENQKQGIKIEQVSLNAVVLDTLSRYSGAIQSKNISVSTVFLSDYQVSTDCYLVSIIINNLISNALKYSNQNSNLTLAINDKDSEIEFCLTDTGIGISSEDLERIFSKFYRSKSSEHQEIKGTGLGLSIVKRLCSLLNIGISISSQENRGTTVFLSFYKADLK